MASAAPSQHGAPPVGQSADETGVLAPCGCLSGKYFFACHGKKYTQIRKTRLAEYIDGCVRADPALLAWDPAMPDYDPAANWMCFGLGGVLD